MTRRDIWESGNRDVNVADLTPSWTDYYLKSEDRDYALANPLNLRPIFTQEQLAISLETANLIERI